MDNYVDEFAMMIYSKVFNMKIPKAIVDLIVSFASGHWLKSVEESFFSES